MQYWPVLVFTVSLLGSVGGSYLAVRVSLARIEEQLKSHSDRVERHSNRLNRLEDKYFKG